MDCATIIIIIIINWLNADFYTPAFLVFHWSLSDNNLSYPRCLADLNNAVELWSRFFLLFTIPLIFFSNHLETVPSAPITIGITVTFMVHSFWNSLKKSKYFVLFLFSVYLNVIIAVTTSCNKPFFALFECNIWLLVLMHLRNSQSSFVWRTLFAIFSFISFWWCLHPVFPSIL